MNKNKNIETIKLLAKAIYTLENQRYAIVDVSNPSIINLAGEIERLAEEVQNETN